MVRDFIADGSGISAAEAAKLAKAEPELYQRYLAAGKTGGALDPALRDTIRASIGQVPDPEGIATTINRDVDGDGIVDVTTITNAGVATVVLGQATPVGSSGGTTTPKAGTKGSTGVLGGGGGTGAVSGNEAVLDGLTEKIEDLPPRRDVTGSDSSASASGSPGTKGSPDQAE